MFNNFYQNKRVLVTGHTGFKGSWLTEWLLALGAEVAGFSAYIPSQPANFDVLQLNNRVNDYRGDIRNIDELTKVFDEFQPEVLFHLAAQPIVKVSYENPKLTFDTNVGGTVDLLEILRRGTSVENAVFITSDKCYENVEWEYGYRETDRLGGKDPYSASKACAEIAISAYSRSFFENSSLRIASARAGNVIGGGDWADARIVPDCVRAWSQHDNVVVRNPFATRPWQHVLEPLSGYLWLGVLLSQKTSLSGEAFNFGPHANVNQPVEVLIRELASYWGDNPNWYIESSIQQPANKEAGLLKLCCDKALSHLDWQPTLNFDEVMSMTSGWYKTYYQGKTDMMKYTRDQIDSYVQKAIEGELIWAK